MDKTWSRAILIFCMFDQSSMSWCSSPRHFQKPQLKQQFFQLLFASPIVCQKNFQRNKFPYWSSVVTWTFWVSLVLYTGSKHTKWSQSGIAITLLIQGNTRRILQSKFFRSVFWYIVFDERRNIVRSFAKEPLEISLLRSCEKFCHMKFFWYLGRLQTWNLCNINQSAPATR